MRAHRPLTLLTITLAVLAVGCGEQSGSGAPQTTLSGTMTLRPTKPVAVGQPCTNDGRPHLRVESANGAASTTARLDASQWEDDPDLPGVQVCALRFTVTIERADSYRLTVGESPPLEFSIEDLESGRLHFLAPDQFHDPSSYTRTTTTSSSQ